MTPERWQEVKELLTGALEIEPPERADYLDRSCAGDASLRSEVEQLLRDHEEADPNFLTGTAFGSAVSAVLADDESENLWIGRRIGPYRIVEQIGAGGMGEVYSASRADDEYHKDVALKIVRAGQDSRFFIGRFKNERQILASLDHPNIAKLLDGGTTDEGVPYFVMELIEGQPITQYCDDHRLGITERLKLFLQVCAAVQYAHQRLIIHRDIKPGNILVTSDGVPKLLDFGIAKIVDFESEMNDPNATVTGFRAMTPHYASPEQINGEPMTTASDVYSLGVVLYELLTGRSPYRLAKGTAQQIANAVRDTEPQRPSLAIERSGDAVDAGSKTSNSDEVGAVRDSTPEKLGKLLQGDLDNIVLMSLRKESSLRYPSVEQFSQDIRRHLESIPVLARKSTLTYRGAKFVRRHQVGVIAACFIFVLALGSAVAIIRAERQARIEQARAERRFNDVRKLANSLMFEIHDSMANLPGATASRLLIVQRAQEYLDSLAAESNSDPTLLRELAAAYIKLANVLGDSANSNVGNSQEALKDFHRAVELREAVVAALPADRDARCELAESYMGVAKANLLDGKQYLDRATALLKPLSDSYPDDLKIKYELARAAEFTGGFYALAGKWSDALSNYANSLALYQSLAEKVPGNGDYQKGLAAAHKHMGSTLIMQKKLDPALQQYLAALGIDEKQISADPLNAAARYSITFTYSDTALILKQQGDMDGALKYYREALAIRQALADADPNDTRARAGVAKTNTAIGHLLTTEKQFQQAITYYKAALAIRTALSHSDPSNVQKRLEAAQSQAYIAEDYERLAFDPHTSHSQRLALCQQLESLLKEALPVYREQRDKMVGFEVGQLAEAEETAKRCSIPLKQLRDADKN